MIALKVIYAWIIYDEYNLKGGKEMKVWAKTRVNGEYHSHNIAHAVIGFRELGAEIIKYEKIDEIYQWVTKDDIVLDYIDQCLTIFDKFGKRPHLEDYPEVLKKYLGREIWTDTINSINSNPDKWGIFVKPIKEKVFTGKVIKGSADLVGCGSCYENYEVLCSTIMDIKREWRGFMYYDKLIDLRPYKGDWHYSYDPEVIDNVIKAFTSWEDRPVACSLDFAVILDSDGLEKTIFLEANDAYAFGNYGLHHIMYAKLISARWSQILDRPDEYNFTL